MKNPFRYALCALVLFSATGLVRAADTEAILKKARSFIGSEADLNNLTSVRYRGTLEMAQGTEATPDEPGKLVVEIVFQKPYQQRITATAPEKTEVTALNNYDAWQREHEPANPANWRMNLLGSDQIKRLRANTWENLAFFRGIASRGGRIEDLGNATIEGVDCRKIAFVHDANIAFHRYFDVATGRLVLTETESGSSIREEGEILVSGLRFPRKIVTSNKLADGTINRVSVTFDSIELNQTFPESLFEVPLAKAE